MEIIVNLEAANQSHLHPANPSFTPACVPYYLQGRSIMQPSITPSRPFYLLQVIPWACRCPAIVYLRPARPRCHGTLLDIYISPSLLCSPSLSSPILLNCIPYTSQQIRLPAQLRKDSLHCSTIKTQRHLSLYPRLLVSSSTLMSVFEQLCHIKSGRAFIPLSKRTAFISHHNKPLSWSPSPLLLLQLTQWSQP